MTIIAAIVLVATVSLITLATEGSDATDVMGDWVIEGRTVSLSNETIDVRGNVTVRDGGVLRLDDCLLILNSSDSRRTTMYVNATGGFQATATTIIGATGTESMVLSGDTEIRECHIRGLGAHNYQATAIGCWAGNISILDSVIEDTNGGAVFTATHLQMSRCTLRNINGHGINIETRFFAGPVTVQVLHCVLTGASPLGEQRFDGLRVIGSVGGPKLALCVRDTLIERWSCGFYISAYGECDVLVEDCELLRNNLGAWIIHSQGDVNLTGNVIGHEPEDDSGGICLKADPRFVSIAGNVVEHVGIGYMFFGHLADADDAESWSGLEVESCRWGMFVACDDYGHDYWLEVHNSSFRNITDPNGTFVTDYFGGDLTVSVFDTEHEPGSAMVKRDWNTVQGYLTLDVKNVRWLRGPPIWTGSLSLTDAASARQALSVDGLAPVQFMSWRATTWSSTVLPFVTPHMESGGHDFKCLDIELGPRTRVNCTVEVVDDVPPEVTVSAPADGQLTGLTRVVAKGTCKDLGSGIRHLAFSLDGVILLNRTESLPGQWGFTLTDLRTGLHRFGASAIDLSGNVGEVVWVEFTVDDVPPFIIVMPHPDLVNTQTLHLEGCTEAGSTLTMNDMAYYVDGEGLFSEEVQLAEGENTIRVRVVDRAGNVNSTLLSVVRDTKPPELRVVSPEDGAWTNARTVLVEGYISLDATLRVNGVPVPFSSGSFNHIIDVQEGRAAISLLASDPAGNLASLDLTLNVDWTPPLLTMLWPMTNLTYTKRSEAQLQGDVLEDHLGGVSVNGMLVKVTLGLFMVDLVLSEGTYVYSVLATDLAGNAAGANVTIVRDLTPPELSAQLIPRDGRLVMAGERTYLTGPTLELHLAANEHSTFTMDGWTQGPCRACIYALTLHEGENVLIVLATDLTGNQAVAYSKRVTLDTTPPPIVVHTPKDGLMTAGDYVLVRGETDPDARLTINGAVLHQGEYGTFEMRVRLDRGTNEIVVTVADAVGNVNTTTLEVTRERGFKDISEDWVASGATVVGLSSLVIALLLVRSRVLGAGRSNASRVSSERTDDNEGTRDGSHRKTI